MSVPRTTEMLSLIGQLHAVVREAKDLDAATRQALRQFLPPSVPRSRPLTI